MAAAGSFVVRMRTPLGMKRFAFQSELEKFGVLQHQLEAELGIPVAEQLISLSADNYLLNCANESFRKLNIKHGDLLNIVTSGVEIKVSAASAAAAAAAPAAPAHKLTSKCQHSAKDRCIHCMPAELGQGEAKMKCNHPVGAKCIHCPTFDAKAASKGKCQHAAHQFCINCAPDEKKDANDPRAEVLAKKKMYCKCTGGQKCIHCSAAEQLAAVKVNYVPFARVQAERRALCHFKHGPETTCVACAPEPMPNYLGNPNCTNGHLPWPKSSCSKCMPPNAVLKSQPYRHCDYVQVIDVPALQNKFVGEWLKNPAVQRAVLLFGNYIDEPAETRNPGAIRALVQSIYYPPQENHGNRVNFKRDLKENDVLQVAAALGMHPVGWCITSPFRGADADRFFLTAPEIRQAAQFQMRYTDAETGRSPFFTMVMEINAQQLPEPVAYQVVDNGVALEAAGVLVEVPADITKLAVRAAKKGEFLPGVMYKSKLMNADEPFVPDELVVPVVVSAGGQVKPKPFFETAMFPFIGTSAHLSAHLTRFKAEAWEKKLSDFCLLIHLPAIIGMPRTLVVCDALKNKRALTALERSELEKALKAASISF